MVTLTLTVVVLWTTTRKPTAYDAADNALPVIVRVEPEAAEIVLAQPPPDREPIAAMPAPKSNKLALKPTDFRDPSLFVNSDIYNTRGVVLDAKQEAAFRRLLSEIDFNLKELRTKIHSVAARHIPEVISLGLANIDSGAGVDRMGDKEIRVFAHSGVQQYYVDFDRNQYADLDVLFLERDQLIEAGHGLVVDFFSALYGKDK